MTDQDRISPFNINTIQSRQVIKISRNYQSGDYKLIQYQILQTNITTTVCRQLVELSMRSWELKG